MLLFITENGGAHGKYKRDCETGECVGTVSRVLNRHPYVSEEKRRLVNQVMKELDYTPNRTAIDLIRGKTNTIGVILPYSDHPCFDKIVNGITKEAFAHDYVTTLLPTNYDPAIEMTYFELLKMKRLTD